jgi:UDP-glucose:(heptosyl)LPS alpha-1,3-glucosyltransferase
MNSKNAINELFAVDIMGCCFYPSCKSRNVLSNPRNGAITWKIMPDNENLRIAVLIKRFVSTGGAERYAMEVTRRLALQHEVHVFAQEWSYEGKEEIAFHKIPKYLAKPSWFNQLLFSYHADRGVDGSFDIVHSHEKVARFDVMTIHSPCVRSSVTHEKRAWKRFLGWFSLPLSPHKMGWLLLEKKQFSHHSGKLFLPVSENVKRDVQIKYSLPDDCFRIAYPGVDSKMKKSTVRGVNGSAVRSKLGIAEDELVFLFVGTEFKRKGLDALLRGFALLKPCSNTRLIVAGGGGGKMREYVQLAKNLDLSDHVLFAGLVKNVGELYSIADACILPTLSDPFGMAPVEAMLSGVPVALSSSTYCGAAEIIKGGEALIIKNPQDHHEIKEALCKLMDAGCRAELSRKGQALAAEFTWEHTTARTLSAYEEVLRRKKQGHQPPIC